MAKRGRVIYGKTKRYFIDDQEVTKAEFDAVFPTSVEGILASGLLQKAGKKGWPMKSFALGVAPRQAKEATERAKRNKIAVTYCEKTGDAIIPSEVERRKLMKLEGAHCKNSFY